MYREDIRELKSQKREANREILWEFVRIYLRMRLFFPHFQKERDNLVALVQTYFQADQNESEVLDSIRKYYGKREDHEGIDELLDDFDGRFEKIYQYCQDTFEDYEEVLFDYWDLFSLLELRLRSLMTGEMYEPGKEYRYRMIESPIRFPIFDEPYKQKMLELIPHLPEPEEPEEVDF